jgi:hypothetical protein
MISYDWVRGGTPVFLPQLAATRSSFRRLYLRAARVQLHRTCSAIRNAIFECHRKT